MRLTGSSEFIDVKMPHCWKPHVAAQIWMKMKTQTKVQTSSPAGFVSMNILFKSMTVYNTFSKQVSKSPSLQWLRLLSVLRWWFCFCWFIVFMYLTLVVGVLCWSLFCYAFLYVLSSFAMIFTMKRKLIVLLKLSDGGRGSSSRCRGVVCSVWLWYFLIILTYFQYKWNQWTKTMSFELNMSVKY